MAGSIDFNLNKLDGYISRLKAIDSSNKTVAPLTSGSGDNQGMTYYTAKQIEEVIGKIEWSFDFLVSYTAYMLEDVKKTMETTDQSVASKIGGA